MMWFIYNVLFTIGYMLMLPKFLWRMKRRGGYRRNFLQRLGCYSTALQKELRERDRIWIHAVSVGELGVAFGLIDAMRAIEPGLYFLISTTTSTGYAVAERRRHPDDALMYFPADFPSVIRRVLTLAQPRAIILTETELWPNLLCMAGRRHIPLFLVNGRVSDSSFKGYRYLGYFLEEVLGNFTLMLVQSTGDQQRLAALGARSTRLVITGSVKYDSVTIGPGVDQTAAKVLTSCGIDSSRRVVVAGSTWAGEEAILLDIHKRQVAAFRPKPLLVLVPRHAERAAAIVDEIKMRNLSFIKRSDVDGGDRPKEADVLIVDTTGELMSFYSAADIVFVGKSLTQRGGQNILEPAALGKPILVGPNMQNFPVIIDDFLEHKALMQVQTGDALEAGLKAFLQSREMREKYGLRARQLVESRRGAMPVTARRIMESLAMLQDGN
jgi:3-deoxy-D-manno-octulosonic-acid transferase